jgi:hypothetical protein
VCSRHTVHTRESSDRMIMKYTHDEYCDMLLTVATCNGWADTAAGEYSQLYTGRSHQTLRVPTIGAASPWDSKRYDKREDRSPTDFTDIRQWRCHSCSYWTRAVGRLTRHGTRIGTIPAEGPRSTLWWSIVSIPLIADDRLPRMKLCGWLHNTLQMS